MSQRWSEDVVYLVFIALSLIVTGVVYAVLKRRNRNANSVALFDRVEKWVEGIFFAMLIGSLVFITVRYS
jgi:hypothetical protein